MRERDEIPEWALDAARRHLRNGEEIVNATAFRVGTKHAVLLNTSKGAALVVKGMVGGPSSVVLAFPQDLITYRCHACTARNIVIDIQPPDDVHCTHCGHAQHLVRAGEVNSPARKDDTANRPGRARRAARKKAPQAKTTPRAGRAKRAPSAQPRKAPATSRASRGTRKSRPKAPTSTTGADYRPQCLALTPDDAQCRNSARKGSKYCGVHKSYHPPAAARARQAKDTTPRVRGAKDTAPSGRKKSASRSTRR